MSTGTIFDGTPRPPGPDPSCSAPESGLSPEEYRFVLQQEAPATVALLRVEAEWMVKMLGLCLHPLPHEAYREIAGHVSNALIPNSYPRPPHLKKDN